MLHSSRTVCVSLAVVKPQEYTYRRARCPPTPSPSFVLEVFFFNSTSPSPYITWCNQCFIVVVAGVLSGAASAPVLSWVLASAGDFTRDVIVGYAHWWWWWWWVMVWVKVLSLHLLFFMVVDLNLLVEGCCIDKDYWKVLIFYENVILWHSLLTFWRLNQ